MWTSLNWSVRMSSIPPTGNCLQLPHCDNLGFLESIIKVALDYNWHLVSTGLIQALNHQAIACPACPCRASTGHVRCRLESTAPLRPSEFPN